MKLQIRSGVFETNSSSTHSLQVVTGNIDSAINYVNDLILKAYKPEKNDDEDNGYFSIYNYIRETKNKGLYDLEIKGIEFDDGDENGNVYCIIKNWMAKIQYIAMILYAYKSDEPENRKYWEWFDEKWGRNSWNQNYGVNHEYMDDLNNSPNFFNSETCTLFKNFVKEYIESNTEFKINNVLFDENIFSNELYLSGDYEGFNNELLSNENKLINKFRSFMDDNEIMIYADEAYSPYEKPIIKIY